LLVCHRTTLAQFVGGIVLDLDLMGVWTEIIDLLALGQPAKLTWPGVGVENVELWWWRWFVMVAVGGELAVLARACRRRCRQTTKKLTGGRQFVPYR